LADNYEIPDVVPAYWTSAGSGDTNDLILPNPPTNVLNLPSLGQLQAMIQSALGTDGAVDPSAIPEAIQQLISALNVAVNPDPGTDPGTNPGTGSDTDPEPETTPGETEETELPLDDNSQYLSPGLESVFPFCIPFDLIDCFKAFSAEAKAPCFEFPLKIERFGIDEVVTIDLSPWEPVAEICRVLMIIAFIVALISVTRNLIGS
jgi:hypothetical protein